MPLKKHVKAMFKAVRDGDLAAVRALADETPDLVNTPAEPPPKKDWGQSPLQVALKTDHMEVARFLVERGADVRHIEDPSIPQWRTPVLHDAVRAALITLCYPGDKGGRSDAGASLVRLLLDRGADASAVDSYGNNALLRAISDAATAMENVYGPETAALREEKARAVVAMIAATGADPDHKAPEGLSARELARHRGVGHLLAQY